MARSVVHVPLLDPRLPAFARAATCCGLAVVLCLPAARGSHALLGWWPLWLVLMPLLAWALLALRGRDTVALQVNRRRRGGPQARTARMRTGRRSGTGVAVFGYRS
ncbi:MAG: hypothetical protein Q4F49_01935 [Pseudoxanthomonas suwonensis]|nr:hypothetical protein [Pseudoxanthomonas suwonensis]